MSMYVPPPKGPLPDAVRRQHATQATLEKYRNKPFSWDGATCAHLLRFHLRQMGHKPPRMPSFRSAVGAKAALRKMGATDMVDLMRKLGLTEIPSARMMLGDIAVLPGDDGLFDAIVISAGHKFMGWHGDGKGLAVMELHWSHPDFELKGAFSA